MPKSVLRHIMVIGLPPIESRKLILNLIKQIKPDNGENRLVCYPGLSDNMDAALYCLPEHDKGREWGGGHVRLAEEEAFLADFANYLPQECLMVSGEPCCLQLAQNYGIAALGYESEEAAGSQERPRAVMYAQGFEEIDWYFLRHVYERYHGLPWTILQTPRCVLREFSMERLPELYQLYQGQGMTDYIEPLFPYEKELEYQKAYIKNMYGFYGFGMWIVCDRQTGELIGRVGLEFREESGGILELGYAIGVPYQGLGYATETCLAVLSFARDKLEAEEIYCLIQQGNEPSLRLAGHLGFHRVDELNLDGKCMIRFRKYL